MTLAAMASNLSSLLEHREDVFLADDQVVFPVERDLAAGVLAEQDLVALLDLERRDLAVVVHLAGAHRDHESLLGLLLGGVGDDDAALGLGLGLEALDQDAVVQGSELHRSDLLKRTGAPRQP